jgi:hypothetical protein
MSRDLRNTPSDQLMFDAALAALRQPLLSGLHSSIPVAYVVPDILKYIQDNTTGVSEVRRNMANKYLVVFNVHKKRFHQRSRDLGSSYFLRFNEDTACQPQVHILDTKAANLENCHVLTFNTEPTDRMIEDALNEARIFLRVPEKKTTRTPAIILSEQLFRSDGVTERRVLDKFAAAIKLAMHKDNASDFQIALKLSANPPQTTEPITYVVFTRQSAEESGSLQNTSIPRQTTSILMNAASPIHNLKPGDRILVVVEVCSSHKHPMKDRKIFDRIPDNENLVFLTANPDRLTRRHDEIDELLKRGKWFSSGMHEVRNEWFDVGEHAEMVKDRLLLGKNVERSSLSDNSI